MTNQIYATDYHPIYSYIYAQKYFGRSESVVQNIETENFYKYHFGLLINLRTLNDEKSYGIGRRIEDYIKFKISKKSYNN